MPPEVRKSIYTFNTLITDLPTSGKSAGAINPETHNEQVIPLFKALNVDGITKIEIYRSKLEVCSLDRLITQEELDRTVTEAVTNVAQLKRKFEEGDTEEWQLFPLRGNKSPEATLVMPREPEPKKPSRYQFVFGYPGTNIARYRTMKEDVDTFDTKRFDKRVYKFGQAMADLDGVLGLTVFVDAVRLKIDTEVTSPEEAQKHMTKVFQDAVNNEEMSDILPYIDDVASLKFTFVLNDA